MQGIAISLHDIGADARMCRDGRSRGLEERPNSRSQRSLVRDLKGKWRGLFNSELILHLESAASSRNCSTTVRNSTFPFGYDKVAN